MTGRVVRVRDGLCDGGQIGTVIDATRYSASDVRAYRWSLSIRFDDGRTNVYTERDVTVLR